MSYVLSKIKRLRCTSTDQRSQETGPALGRLPAGLRASSYRFTAPAASVLGRVSNPINAVPHLMCYEARSVRQRCGLRSDDDITELPKIVLHKPSSSRHQQSWIAIVFILPLTGQGEGVALEPLSICSKLCMQPRQRHKSWVSLCNVKRGQAHLLCSKETEEHIDAGPQSVPCAPELMFGCLCFPGPRLLHSRHDASP